MDWTPVVISLKTAFSATVITFFLGLSAARGLLKVNRFRGLIDGVFTLPMVLPPTVVGFFLILILGQNGIIGKAFSALGFSILFSWQATVEKSRTRKRALSFFMGGSEEAFANKRLRFGQLNLPKPTEK